MTPALFRQAGESLYGPHWQGALAEALGVSDRTLRRWLAETSPLPAGIAGDIAELCRAQSVALRELGKAVADQGKRAP